MSNSQIYIAMNEHQERYYLEQFKIKNELTRQAIQQKLSFLRSLLLVSVSIVGIVISLHNTKSQCLYIRLVFLLSILLLTLGILSTGIATYNYASHSENLRQAFHSELEQAVKKNRQLAPIVSVNQKKNTVFFEKASYLLLISGFITLVIYTGLNTF